MHQKEAHL